MVTFIFVLHLFSCFFLIGLILLQRGKGADIGATFGGASQTVFGSRGPATFLNKMTIIVAVVFLGASLFLANVARHKETATVIDEARKLKTEEKVLQEEPVVEEEKAPVEKVDEGIPVKEEGK